MSPLRGGGGLQAVEVRQQGRKLQRTAAGLLVRPHRLTLQRLPRPARPSLAAHAARHSHPFGRSGQSVTSRRTTSVRLSTKLYFCLSSPLLPPFSCPARNPFPRGHVAWCQCCSAGATMVRRFTCSLVARLTVSRRNRSSRDAAALVSGKPHNTHSPFDLRIAFDAPVCFPIQATFPGR